VPGPHEVHEVVQDVVRVPETEVAHEVYLDPLALVVRVPEPLTNAEV
jgi:hypothetical protein